MANTIGQSGSASLDDRGLRTVIPIGAGAKVMTASFPGLYMNPEGGAVVMPDAVEDDLAILKQSGARLVLLLPEEHELPSGATRMVQAAALDIGLDCHCLPIADYHAPGDLFLEQWDEWRCIIQSHFDAGQGLAICCRYGAGRSGTVAAMLLIDRGLSPADAVKTVRAQFAPSVESEVQHQWLQHYASGLRSCKTEISAGVV